MCPKNIFTTLIPPGLRNKLVAGILSASLMSSTALAHTNSIGYVGDGNGGLNFWYGNWHGQAFNEAEIKIIHPDGTTSIDAFNLLSQNSPAGLISGVNFFTSDGTQLVPYDPTGATNGGTTQESYVWQGINYQNLVTGQYTFVYIPLGDAESSYPNQNPTADWDPMDQVIRSLTINLTTGDLTGDANNNGILDINEVAAGAASGLTVVSQGTSQVIGYIATTNGLIQVIKRTQTDTTWDNMSDGTIANQQSSTSNPSDWVGRVDQIATAQDAINITVRNIDFDGISSIHSDHKYDNGMKGSTKGYSFGGKRQNEERIVLGGGIAKSTTNLKNGYNYVKAKTNTYMGSIGKEFDFGYMEIKAQRSVITYNVSRAIGDFVNSTHTKGSDSNISIMFNKNINEKLSVISGVTRGKQFVTGYTEDGSVQSARTVAKYTKNYTYGTIGGSLDLGLLDLSAIHHTDGVNEISTGLSKDTGKVTWKVKVTKSMSTLGDSNLFNAGLNLKF